MTSPPPADTPATPPAPAASAASRRALAAALACGTLGAAAVLVASGRVWGEGTAVLAQGELPIEVTGGEVTGLPSALALVALAALVAVFAVRRAGRTLVAALLTLCGAGTAVAAPLAVRGGQGTAALDAEAAEVTGLTRGAVESVAFGPWPWVTAAGGALLLVAGLLALRHGRAWPAMSGRHERAGGARPGRGKRPVSDPDRPEELWKALDRGEDPTAGGGGKAP
ncbi:TIGR02234 family membrane protein [Streptomyces macrosporus]|uniref:TIGR02234 family membrane protein n=1 Tax=Streptomyces macrosporus TaxID=44032 RepID=A0ABN3JYW1_9ACTN